MTPPSASSGQNFLLGACGAQVHCRAHHTRVALPDGVPACHRPQVRAEAGTMTRRWVRRQRWRRCGLVSSRSHDRRLHDHGVERHGHGGAFCAERPMHICLSVFGRRAAMRHIKMRDAAWGWCHSVGVCAERVVRGAQSCSGSGKARCGPWPRHTLASSRDWPVRLSGILWSISRLSCTRNGRYDR